MAAPAAEEELGGSHIVVKQQLNFLEPFHQQGWMKVIQKEWKMKLMPFLVTFQFIY